MPRNLDTALIRSFVTVADTRSMTGAAQALHLTQAAVSQQIKRLEEAFGASLFERDRRGMVLTDEGERLFGRAKRFLGLNDEIWAEMTTPTFSGSVKLGIPFDLVGTYLPTILKSFAAAYPQVEVSLICLNSFKLIEATAAGEIDVALAEEPIGQASGECLATDRLIWIGAKGGDAHLKRPLPLSFGGETCAFRTPVFDALRQRGLGWRIVSEVGNAECLMVTTQMDLAVTAVLASTIPPGTEPLKPDSGLPDLPPFSITLHWPRTGATDVAQALGQHIRKSFMRPQRQAA